MANGSHFTLLSLRIGKLFIIDRRRRRWNKEIANNVGSKPNSTHAVLKQFEEKGWVSGVHEQNVDRKPRKLYALTDSGAEAIGAVLKPLQLAST